MLFVATAKLQLANIKLSELLQVLLILANCENKIFFKTFLLLQEYQLVKLFWGYFPFQGGQQTWNFWKPGKVRKFHGTWKMSGKSQGNLWNLEKSGKFVKLGKVREFNTKLGKVGKFYLCETNIAEVSSKFIQVVNKN